MASEREVIAGFKSSSRKEQKRVREETLAFPVRECDFDKWFAEWEVVR